MAALAACLSTLTWHLLHRLFVFVRFAGLQMGPAYTRRTDRLWSQVPDATTAKTRLHCRGFPAKTVSIQKTGLAALRCGGESSASFGDVHATPSFQAEGGATRAWHLLVSPPSVGRAPSRRACYKSLTFPGTLGCIGLGSTFSWAASRLCASVF